MKIKYLLQIKSINLHLSGIYVAPGISGSHWVLYRKKANILLDFRFKAGIIARNLPIIQNNITDPLVVSRFFDISLCPVFVLLRRGAFVAIPIVFAPNKY